METPMRLSCDEMRLSSSERGHATGARWSRLAQSQGLEVLRRLAHGLLKGSTG